MDKPITIAQVEELEKVCVEMGEHAAFSPAAMLRVLASYRWALKQIEDYKQLLIPSPPKEIN